VLDFSRQAYFSALLLNNCCAINCREIVRLLTHLMKY